MKTLTKILLFIILFFNFISCIEPSDKNIEVFINQTSKPIEELTNLALKNGDRNAYNELSRDYMDSPYNEFLYTALIMANKYDYSRAYLDVFYCLTDFYRKDSDEKLLIGLDDKTKEMALDYLRLSAEKNDINAIKILNNLSQ